MKKNTKRYFIFLTLILLCIVFCVGCGKSERTKDTTGNETVNTVDNVKTKSNDDLTDTQSMVNSDKSVSNENTGNTESSSGTEKQSEKIATDMIPIETDLDGAHNSMFVITIDGQKYRYKRGAIQDNNLTYGDMIYKWDNNKGSVYEFYAVKEHPDYKYLKCISNENGYENEFLIEYAPATGLPEGALDEIINDGFLVMKNGSVISGEDKWLEFVNKTEAKEPAEIDIAYYFTLNGRMAKNLYEMTKMDYPLVYLHRLKYDGEKYVFSPLKKSDGEDKYVVTENDEIGWEETYKYMKHYTEAAPSDTALFNTFDKYVLVNDDTITWDDIWNGNLSSDFGAAIKNAVVFNKYDYKDGVDPDEVITVDIDI